MSFNSLFTIQSVIKTAIERERMSAKLYERAQSVVKDPRGKKMLEALRQEELRHEKLLTAALERDDLDIIGAKLIQNQELPGENTVDTSIDENSGPLELLEFGIRHEEMAVDYYSRYMVTFLGTDIGELFERLRKEEEAHKQKLQRQYQKMLDSGEKPAAKNRKKSR